MDKYLFPILMTFIIIFIVHAFKPTSNLTYTDEAYFENLQKCKSYEVEGRLNIVGNTSSLSKINGYHSGKCVLETVNVFRMYNSTLATNCALDKEQLNELYLARFKPSISFSGFTDRSIVDKFKKNGACVSYKLSKNSWKKIN